MAMDKLMLLNEVARSILEAEDDDSGPSQPKKPKTAEDPDPGPFILEGRDRELSPRPFVPVTQCCYLLCHDKVPKDDQRKLWDLWENTMDKAAQDEYLSSLIEFRPPATVKVEPKRNRNFLWRYTINPNGTEIQCCQKFLLKLYQISEKRLRVIQEKTRNGDSFVERRGKHSRSRPKLKAQNLWDLAEAHLATLPSTQGLDGTDKRYLKDSSLTIKKVWAMFEEWYEATTGQELVGLSYKTYHKKFSASKKYAFLYQLVIPDEISGNTWLDEPTKQLMEGEEPPKGKKRKGKSKK
ncbi:unnamed protein product [Bemisia tabaci]|uniref:Uncharacterized protein n=1 Tax=Bemisia tabaci TaxID=7038 RepID=A0A9P0G1G4_BEMTA|nr:unnamed protein product [Bemisia tabaci]